MCTETLNVFPQYLHANSMVVPQIKVRTALFHIVPNLLFGYLPYYWHILSATYSKAIPITGRGGL
jgi:hypothetical protein